MNVLVTGANGQLGNELRLLAAATASPAAEANYFSCSCSKNQFASAIATPSHAVASSSFADPDRRISFLFTDVVDASEESIAMLQGKFSN